MLVWFFSHLGFLSGNLFLIAPFPDLCLLVSFQIGLIYDINLSTVHLYEYAMFIIEQNFIFIQELRSLWPRSLNDRSSGCHTRQVLG